MIIWINGSFGAGKTTVSEILKEKIENSVTHNPEEVGGFLARTMPMKKNCFQDYELWRIINFEIIKYLNTEYNKVIVPMTVTNKQYYNEIVGRLKSECIDVKDFILIASKDNLIKRLDGRKDSTEWAYNQLDRCVEAFQSDFDGHKIDTDNKSADEAACEILKLINNS